MRWFFIAVLFSSLSVSSCINPRTTVSAEDVSKEDTSSLALPVSPNKPFVLKKDYDLEGMVYVIPIGVEIISQGGVFKNGTLIGNNTRIKNLSTIFQNVTIKGEWNVPQISTSMFKDLTYTNSLRDVLALSSPKLHNVVSIEVGDYEVSATSFDASLSINSDTEVIIDGRIKLVPNDYRGCYVVQVKDAQNVFVHGKGCIEGDRFQHTGNSGEWGHGIYVAGSRKVRIAELTVKDCWGDCVYIGNGSSNVTIDGCKLSKGRRQGVSITSGSDICIKNCVISEVQGTRPQFAIDVEPNKGETVDKVLIENVRAVNCYGGFKSWGGAERAHIGTVTIRNCTVVGASADYPVKFVYGDRLVVKGCRFNTGDKTAIYTDVVKDVTIKDNVVNTNHRDAVHVSRAKTKVIENNREIRQ